MALVRVALFLHRHDDATNNEVLAQGEHHKRWNGRDHQRGIDDGKVRLWTAIDKSKTHQCPHLFESRNDDQCHHMKALYA